MSILNYQDGQLIYLNNVQTLPDDQLHINNHIAEIKIHPSGKFVYVSNRGHNSLTLLTRNTDTGQLTFVKCFSSQGSMPWSFELSTVGDYLYCSNRKSNNVTCFKINRSTGELTYTGQKISVNEPSCLKLIP